MRIEYQGYVEVKPSYSHVGYISAAPMPGVFTANSSGAGVYLGLILLCAVMARQIAVRGKGALRLIGFLACLTAAGAAVIGLVLTLKHYELTPTFTVTIQRMERLSEATEAFETQHKRLPTQAEWAHLASPADRSDGWGQPLIYTTESPSAPSGAPRYEITVAESTWRSSGRLYSSSFGPDGLFGTKDDSYKNYALGPLRYRHVDLTALPHGRRSRTGDNARLYGASAPVHIRKPPSQVDAAAPIAVAR